MSTPRSASLCTFTFSDGRRCRMPRKSGHSEFCYFHARREAQAQTAEQLGRDFAFFLSGDYFSACDLAAALSRLFSAVARGDVKPRAAATLAYLSQTLLLTIQAAENEYINAFGTDSWRRVVFDHAKQNAKYLAHGSAELQAAEPQAAEPQTQATPPPPPGTPVEAGLQPSSAEAQAQVTPIPPPCSSVAGLEPGSAEPQPSDSAAPALL